jgi:hypothetical protein
MLILLQRHRNQQQLIYHRVFQILQRNKHRKGFLLFFLQCFSQLFPSYRNPHSRIYNRPFWNSHVPNMDTYEYRSHFRMHRKSFLTLTNLLQPHYINYNAHRGGKPQYPVDFSLAIFIWRIANKCTCREIGILFGIPRSSVIHITRVWNSIIINNLSYLMKLPKTEGQWKEKAEIFQRCQRTGNRMNYPVGAVDGCHIAIAQPAAKEYPETYFNRKGWHSIVLMGLVDRAGLFMAINIGRPGCMADASVFDWSEISKQIPKAMPVDHFVLGDSGFALEYWMMVPIKETRQLTLEEVFYNYVHSSNRNIIERTFGLLKGRFRKLQFVEMRSMKSAVQLVHSTCLIYNFLLLEMDASNNDWFYENENVNGDYIIDTSLYNELEEYDELNQQNEGMRNFQFIRTQNMSQAAKDRYNASIRQTIVDSVWQLNPHA